MGQHTSFDEQLLAVHEAQFEVWQPMHGDEPQQMPPFGALFGHLVGSPASTPASPPASMGDGGGGEPSRGAASAPASSVP
ncbi:MAG TPA: hypothetical protein VIF62_04905 [Labilithrix sp.]